jgi:hypothetical protein
MARADVVAVLATLPRIPPPLGHVVDVFRQKAKEGDTIMAPTLQVVIGVVEF